MTDARFRPRDFTLTPQRFGKPLGVEWMVIPAGDWDVTDDPTQRRDLQRRFTEWRTATWRLQAAQMQHYYALRIRTAITDGYHVQGRGAPRSKVYAKMAGISYDRLVKMLRGDVIMRLEDIATADSILGGISEFTRAETPASEDDPTAGSWPGGVMGDFPAWART